MYFLSIDALDYIFIENGSPDSYLISNELDSYFLNSSNNVGELGAGAAVAAVIDKSSISGNLYNGVAISLGTLFNDTSYGSDNTSLYLSNGSDLIESNSNDTTIEDFTELMKMAATSVVLGLMILITIIGKIYHYSLILQFIQSHS